MAGNEKQQRLMQLTAEFQQMIELYFSMRCRYQSAVREVQTKLEILDDEFESRHKRNPIHHMQSRLKSLESIVEKLNRKNLPLNMASAAEHLTDIAGIRVICPYIDDIYAIDELLTSQDDVRVVKRVDYIRKPKVNGYRSLHLVIEIPVYLHEGKIFVPVEVQIRTIAMDFWASLEHSLRYKGLMDVPEDISRELQQTADEIASLDERMQAIHGRVQALSAE